MWNWLKGCAVAGLVGGLGAAVPEITPTLVVPVAGPGNFQPSGLAVVDGVLFTVSDKHDDGVYRLDPGATQWTARLAVPLRGVTAPGKLDLEGVVPDGAGGFFLVSEEQGRVLHIPKAGTAQWLTDDLRTAPAVKTAELLRTHNAGFEGLALLAPGHFLLAAERQPRGLVEVNLAETPAHIAAGKMPRSPFTEKGVRKADFADLAVWHGRVFALVRNLSLVCELVREPTSPAGWREGVAVSYAQTETDPRYRYTDTKYGLAEGLALDDAHLYVIYDNNGDALAADPSDRRARLFIFANPFVAPVTQ